MTTASIGSTGTSRLSGRSTGRRRVRRAAIVLAGLVMIGRATAAAQVVRFESASYTVPENLASPLGVEFCLVRGGDLSTRIDAFVSTEDGTATGSATSPLFDYCSRSDARVIFFPGSARACQFACIVDDSEEEGDETFSARITAVTPPGQIGSPGAATVTIVDDDGPSSGPVSFTLSDDDHQWELDPLIPYVITVDNTGPPLPALVVTEIVPVSTIFVPEQSTPGWSCDPGPDEGSRCILALGELATGAERSLVFAVQVVEGTPNSFEILDQASLEVEGPENASSADGSGGSCPGGGCVREQVTSPGRYGCLCLFGVFVNCS